MAVVRIQSGFQGTSGRDTGGGSFLLAMIAFNAVIIIQNLDIDKQPDH